MITLLEENKYVLLQITQVGLPFEHSKEKQTLARRYKFSRNEY